MKLERTLANRRFLDGIVNGNFSFLLTDKELAWKWWHLKIDIICTDQYGYETIKEGKRILVLEVEVDLFYLVRQKDYKLYYGIEDYEDIRFASYVRKNLNLHWNDIFTG